MRIVKATNLACPLDGLALACGNGQWTCAQGHAFDIARQGYVHLMPVQQKRSRDPGDSKTMIAARRRFLDTGTYAPIARALNEAVVARLPRDAEACVLDAGCGEGYYLDRLHRNLREAPGDGAVAFVGMDISKWAVQAAARRDKALTWLVGTNKSPPLLPESVDVVISTFGFYHFAGLAGVLKPGGALVLVEPGPEHLIELRAIIYPEVRRREPPALDFARELGLEPDSVRTLRYQSETLSNETIGDLMCMTPHLYRASHAGKMAVQALEALSLSVDVVFRVLLKD